MDNNFLKLKQIPKYSFKKLRKHHTRYEDRENLKSWGKINLLKKKKEKKLRIMRDLLSKTKQLCKQEQN